MSVFSDLLSEYITMKDVGVYPLSQFCGLDRSFMYKIINGKRNPSGEDVVRKMAQFMQLTPQEKIDFMDAFYIAQMGAEVYYRPAPARGKRNIPSMSRRIPNWHRPGGG